MRLLAGALAGQEGRFELVGDESLSARPMERVAEPLRRMGAHVETTDGHAPLVVEGAPLSAIDYELPVPSAQVKSASSSPASSPRARRRSSSRSRPATTPSACSSAPARGSRAGPTSVRSIPRGDARARGGRDPGRLLVGGSVPRRGGDRPGIGGDGPRRRTEPSPDRASRRARAHGREGLRSTTGG